MATTNVAGVPGQASVFLANYYKKSGGGRDAIFSHFDLDSDELVEMPPVVTHSCHLQGGYDPENWELLGATQQAAQVLKDTEKYAADHGVKILKTCTPYLVGNVPKMGEHCAWMESSAVIYCNSVLGARTNTEGRESTSAAMLTGKIPGLRLPSGPLPPRHAQDRGRSGHRQPHGLGHARLLRRRSACASGFRVLDGRLGPPDSCATSTSARRPRRRAASRCTTSSA